MNLGYAFAAAARRIPLSAIGLMQYIGPSIQLLLGLFVYGEPCDTRKLFGFVIVWAALAIYAMDGLRQLRLGSGRSRPPGGSVRRDGTGNPAPPERLRI